MIRWRGVVAVLCAMAMAGAVNGQYPGMQGQPTMRGVWSPVVGSGSAYQMVDKKGEKLDMEIAVVGSEMVEGQTGHWLEMTMPSREGQMVMKHLVVLKGKDAAFLRMIIQQGADEPMEFSMEMLGMMGRGAQRAQKADAREGGTRVGTESITVPAGTFTCEHFKTSDGDDIWVSDTVKPWGLVKATTKDSSMTLMRTITGARTKIRGTPRKFDMQEMMRRQQ